MARPKGLTVQLRPNITRASLPDGRQMVQGESYTITYDDFAKISPAAREEVIEVTAVVTSATARSGVDLTLTETTVDAVLDGASVGRVEEGIDIEDLFMLVKFLDKAHTAGDVVTWADKEARTVTGDRAGGSAATPLEFAGVVVGSASQNDYGWIQITGSCSVVADSNVTAGEVVVLSTTDDTVTSAAVNETITIAIDATGGTFTVTFGGQTTGNIAYNATAAAFKTAFEALSTVGAGNTQVTKASNTFTIEFVGALADANIGTVTTTATNLTGGAGTATVAVVNQGAASSALYVGTALTTVNGGTADVQINAADVKLRHRRSRVRRGQGFPAS